MRDRSVPFPIVDHDLLNGGAAMNPTVPRSEQVVLACYAHSDGNHEPCVIRHVSPHVVASLACHDHVGFNMAERVIDAVESLAELVVATVRARRSNQSLNSLQPEIVSPLLLAIGSSGILEDRQSNVVASQIAPLLSKSLTVLRVPAACIVCSTAH